MIRLFPSVLIWSASCLWLAAAEKLVFEAQFEKGDQIGKSWKLKKEPKAIPGVIASPKGGRIYLGPLPCGEQSLTLKKLPEHSHIRISFDLILAGSWDGSSTHWGPDTWKFSIDQRPPVVFSSFSNGAGTARQSFPDNMGSSFKANRAWAGCKEKNTLGYTWEYPAGKKNGADAVYHFDITMPHREAMAVFKFNSHGVDNDTGKPVFDSPDTQWYGLDSVKVYTLSEGPRMSDANTRLAFKQMTGEDAVKRYQARMDLLASDESTVKCIAAYQGVLVEKQLGKLIVDLGSDDHVTRSKATQLLGELGVGYIAALEKALVDNGDPESTDRLRAVLERIRKRKTGKPASQYKFLLKLIDTPHARKLLEAPLFRDEKRKK